MNLADILTALMQGGGQGNGNGGNGIRGLMQPVGDVLKGPEQWYQRSVDLGGDIARPIVPQMGIPGGGATPIRPGATREDVATMMQSPDPHVRMLARQLMGSHQDVPPDLQGYGKTMNEALYNRALETQRINQMWNEMLKSGVVKQEDQ